MVVTRSSPSPSAHAIPALPPKRRLSLTSLSPNILTGTDTLRNSKNDICVQETTNAYGTNESSQSLESTNPKTRTSTVSKRPPRNPPSASSSVVGKTKTSKIDVCTTPNSCDALKKEKQRKIHYSDDEDLLLKIPDPPTPVETTSIKLAAAKLLESRAKRRRSLPTLLENNEDRDMLRGDHFSTSTDSSKRLCHSSRTSVSQIDDNELSMSLVEPFDSSSKLNLTHELHGFVSSTKSIQESSKGPNLQSSIYFHDSGTEYVHENAIASLKIQGENQNRFGKNRRSILLPSDESTLKCKSLSPKSDESTLKYESLSPKGIASIKKTQILPKCDDDSKKDDEKLEMAKKAVRKLCTLPFEKRCQSAEAVLIEELTGYPVLNPIEKNLQGLLLRGSSSSITQNDLVGNAIPDLENFTAPSDQMKVDLITKLSPYIQSLEEKRKVDSDAMEKSTGYRVARGKNGRFIYSDIKNGQSICPKEYERAYRSVHMKINSLNDGSPALARYDSNGVSRSLSYTDYDNVLATDLSLVLQRYQKPTCRNPLIVEAQRRLRDTVDDAIRKYYKEIREGEM